MSAEDLIERITHEMADVEANPNVMAKDRRHEMAKRAVLTTLAWMEQRTQATTHAQEEEPR